MSGHSQTAAAGAPKVPAAPRHLPGTLLRPPNPPPPPPCTPPATAQLGVPAAGRSSPAGCMYAPAPPAAPAAPAPPPPAPAAPAPPPPAPAAPAPPPPAPVACKGAVVDEEAYLPPPPPPEDSEVDVLPPYPEEDLGLPADPHLSLPPVAALPVPPAPLPATSQAPESDNPSQGVYQSTAKLHEQQQQQEAEEGIRRLQSKYASPGTLLLTPQAPLPPAMAAGPQGQGAGAPPLVASPTAAAVIPRGADVSTPFTSLGDGLTDDDIVQVEMFYRSHKTEVHVCRCLANLYFSSKGSSKEEPEWEFSQTGIPLLLLDSGEHHRQRKLVIILAEKGTGFTLWRDPINHLTKYCAPNPNFHTLHLSKDHTRLVGLSFDDQTAATEFFTTVVNFTSDPDDALMNLSKSKKDKKKEEKKKKKKDKYKPPKKTDISQPCCFMQITKLERQALGVPSSGDQNFMDSMNNLQLSDTASSQGSLHNL